jgi:hypothetical protein
MESFAQRHRPLVGFLFLGTPPRSAPRVANGVRCSHIKGENQ